MNLNLIWKRPRDYQPDNCEAVGCRDDINGVWITQIKVGGMRFWLRACDEHKDIVVNSKLEATTTRSEHRNAPNFPATRSTHRHTTKLGVKI